VSLRVVLFKEEWSNRTWIGYQTQIGMEENKWSAPSAG